MFMRVTRGRFSDPATPDSEAGKHALQDLVTTVKSQPGFQSYLTGGDRASGRTIAVSTWDTEDHAQQSLNAIGEIRSRLEALGLQIEASDFFEVIST